MQQQQQQPQPQPFYGQMPMFHSAQPPPFMLPMPSPDPVHAFLVQRTLAAEQDAFACRQQYANQQATISRLEADLRSAHALQSATHCAHTAALADLAASQAREQTVRDQLASETLDVIEANIMLEQHKEHEETMRQQLASVETQYQEALAHLAARKDSEDQEKESYRKQSERELSILRQQQKEAIAKQKKALAQLQVEHQTSLRQLEAKHQASLATIQETARKELNKSQGALAESRKVVKATGEHIRQLETHAEKSAYVLKLAHVNCNKSNAQLDELQRRIQGITSMQTHIAEHLADCIVTWERKIAYQRFLLQVGGTCAARACKRASPFPPFTPQVISIGCSSSPDTKEREQRGGREDGLWVIA
jgi:chromosome segregation ATPase